MMICGPDVVDQELGLAEIVAVWHEHRDSDLREK